MFYDAIRVDEVETQIREVEGQAVAQFHGDTRQADPAVACPRRHTQYFNVVLDEEVQTHALPVDRRSADIEDAKGTGLRSPLLQDESAEQAIALAPEVGRQRAAIIHVARPWSNGQRPQPRIRIERRRRRSMLSTRRSLSPSSSVKFAVPNICD